MSEAADRIPQAVQSLQSMLRPRTPTEFDRIDVFDPSTSADQFGVQLRLIREEALKFRSIFRATGTPEYVETFGIRGVPYPTKFGLFRAGLSPSPFLTLTNRMFVVRWKAADGSRKTLLFEPTDAELAENTPFYVDLTAQTPEAFRPLFVLEHGDPLGHLKNLGIHPEEIDYLMFDHLHTQDPRRLIGTTKPQADISPNEPIKPWFPNAKLIVQSVELEMIRNIHPLQTPWYQPWAYHDLRPEGILELHGDYLLGPGVAVITTPGHATGNQSLVLNTDTGIWASSENVIATECLTPEHSKIPGLKKYSKSSGSEVVLNGNTIEVTAAQYNSAVKEKSIVDVSRRDGRFLQFFPSSELTGRWNSPGTKPTFTHGHLAHGRLVRQA